MVDLVFKQAAGPTTSDLVFGADGSTPANAFVSLVGVLPGLTMTAHASSVQQLTLTGTFPETLTCTAEVIYTSNTQRPTVGQTSAFVKVAQPTEQGVAQPEQHATRTQTGVQHLEREAVYAHAGNTPRFANAQGTATLTHGQFQDGTGARSSLFARWQDGRSEIRPDTTCSFQDGILARGRLDGRFQDGHHDRRPSRTTRWSDADARRKTYTGKAGPGLPTRLGRTTRYQDAWAPRPGQYVRPVTPVVTPEYWGTTLVFQCPPLALPNLIFSRFACGFDPAGPTGLVVVPVQRVYIVINSVNLTRVDTGVTIPTLSMSMSLDVDSWAWSASAALPGRALDAISPDSGGAPVEVSANVNGVDYRFLVESISRDRSFNQSAIRIGMRGKTALLDAPYAPVTSFTNTEARTMAQLAGDVLTLNGTSFDWTHTWTPEDWLVPAGAFNHQGTYISALNALASAAGGYVAPHPFNQSVRVVSRYPTAPWEWAGATPDFDLPSAVTMQEGIEWVTRPSYNRVFVSGVGQGVLGQITRTGTAGDFVAPMVTDALITDAIGARLRGLPVLANTGRIANVTLKLPVLAETGVIPPGKMIRYTDGGTTRMGISRSVSVSVGSSAVDLRQTIAVETHE